MKKKFAKRLLSWVMAAAMVISMLPISAMASGTSGNVARIGEQEYATLDEAVADAADGATIELLADATTNGLNIHKTLTIQAASGLDSEPTITFTKNGIALGYGDGGKELSLTFKGVNITMTGIGSTPATGEWDWQTICVSSNASLTLDNVDMTMDGENAIGGFDEKTQQYKTVHAIYFCNNNEFNVINNSNITIKNYSEDALEWDGGGGTYRLNITDSSLVADKNRSGLTGTFDAYITNSNVNVTNSRGNGSNGSNYYIKNSSVVNFSNNGNHGISATDLVVENNSVVTADSNGYYGVYVNGDFLVDGTSKMVVTKNSSAGDKAGLKLYTGVTDGKVEKGAVVTITDNYCSGLSNNGKCVFEEGVDLTIMNNDNKQGGDTGSHGGGIYNSGASADLTLPSNAVIYNNHALTDGDDIYNTGTITFGKVGSDWALDDCDHLIDGWYDDSNGTRWEAHAETEEGNHIVEFTNFGENGLATVTGLQALKAAHGKDAKDKTSYPSLDKQVSDKNEGWNNDDVDAAAGQDVNFKLTSNVPDDLLNYIIPDVDEPEIVTPAAANALVPIDQRGYYHLTFHDQMADELEYNDDFIVFLDGNKNGVLDDGEKVLTATTDYTISENVEHTDEDGTVTGTCDFEITMDLVALYEADVIKDADIEAATPIVVTYSAKLSDTATAGSYKNKAWTTVDENDWESSPDTVDVNTYKLSIFKYDQAIGNKPEGGLGGAEFTLTKQDDAAFGTKNLTSGMDGTISLDGLDAGTYILTETKAPDGYVCNSDPQTIVIDEDHNTIAYVVTVNFANAPIPHTGGMGTTLFSIVGGALIATAGVIFVISRKKRARNAA